MERKHNSVDDVKKYLLDGSLPQDMTKNEKVSFYRYTKRFRLDGGILQYRSIKNEEEVYRTVVMTDEDKRKVFDDLHTNGGHMGRNNTEFMINQKFYWLGVRKDVEKWIAECDACQRNAKVLTAPPELKPIVTKETFELIGIDLIGPLAESKSGNKYALTVTDYYSKMVFGFAIPDKSSVHVCKHLASLFNIFGPPKSIMTDQGREFCNDLNTTLFTLYGVQHLVTLAYHPQTNGQDERTNQTLKSIIQKKSNENKDDWDEHIGTAAFAINTSCQNTTQFSPFYLMFLRRPNHFSELGIIENLQTHETTEAVVWPETPVDVVENELEIRLDKMSGIKEIVDANSEKAKARQKKHYDSKVRSNHKRFSFSVGMEVLVKNVRKIGRKGNRLDDNNVGPFLISELTDCYAFLNKLDGKTHKKVALVHLIPYKRPSPRNNALDLPEGVQSAKIDEHTVGVSGATRPADSTPDLVPKTNGPSLDPTSETGGNSSLEQKTAENSSTNPACAGHADQVPTTGPSSDPPSETGGNISTEQKTIFRSILKGGPYKTSAKRFKGCDTPAGHSEQVPTTNGPSLDPTSETGGNSSSEQKTVGNSCINQTHAGHVDQVPTTSSDPPSETGGNISTEQKTVFRSILKGGPYKTGAKRFKGCDTPVGSQSIPAPKRFRGTTSTHPSQSNAKPSTHPSQSSAQTARKSSQYTFITDTHIEQVKIHNFWLTDIHIGAASNLISRTFPHVDGLNNPVLQQNLSWTVPQGEFIQILNVKGNHWITVSNIGLRPDEINIYDSLGKMPIGADLVPICDLVRCQGKYLKVNIMNVCRQFDGDSCGPFAIAFATSLAAGEDPTTRKYDCKSLRSHLYKCFKSESGKFTPFPSSKSLRRNPVRESDNLEVYCDCRGINDRKPMIECGICKEWFHDKCVRFTALPVNQSEDWICSSCK